MRARVRPRRPVKTLCAAGIAHAVVVSTRGSQACIGRQSQKRAESASRRRRAKSASVETAQLFAAIEPAEFPAAETTIAEAALETAEALAESCGAEAVLTKSAGAESLTKTPRPAGAGDGPARWSARSESTAAKAAELASCAESITSSKAATAVSGTT